MAMKINEENFIRYLKKKNEKALDYIIDVYGGLIKSIVKKHLYNLEQSFYVIFTNIKVTCSIVNHYI
ncbi:RNA polymerase sigma-70 factor [Clostridium tetanomorphum DSM 665]|nr:RNA polymerase sigma-70 factor [Clostridium tetanomorphum DSM 665]